MLINNNVNANLLNMLKIYDFVFDETRNTYIDVVVDFLPQGLYMITSLNVPENVYYVHWYCKLCMVIVYVWTEFVIK